MEIPMTVMNKPKEQTIKKFAEVPYNDLKVGEDYYFIKFNAESRNEVIFRNKRFQPSISKRGKHELAIALNGEGNAISYPTIILLSPNLEVENRLNGYLKRNHFLLWLKSK